MTTVCINLKVVDKKALYREAMRVATDQGSLSASAARQMLRPAGNIDVAECLVMVFDPGSMPGVSINQTTVET